MPCAHRLWVLPPAQVLPRVRDIRTGDPAARLRDMAATANDGHMIAEQVWDADPPSGQPGSPAGTGTRSATPLTWSHAQLVRLAWSIEAGAPVERPGVVVCEFIGDMCPDIVGP